MSYVILLYSFTLGYVSLYLQHLLFNSFVMHQKHQSKFLVLENCPRNKPNSDPEEVHDVNEPLFAGQCPHFLCFQAYQTTILWKGLKQKPNTTAPCCWENCLFL